jgi:hypothetical protein
MSLITYVHERGETISIPLDAVAGDPLAVTSVTAKMRMLEPGKRVLNPDAPVAATFIITPRDADGDIPPGWICMIDATTSANLAVGTYLADAKLIVAGGTIIHGGLAVQITEPATI